MSHLFKNNPFVVHKLMQTPPSKICISSITEAELRYGAAKRNNRKLTELVESFLSRIEILSWGEKDAETYGFLRAKMEKAGLVMGAMDLLIAAQAMSRGKIIVTNDSAFSMAAGLLVEDWTQPQN